MNTVSEYQNNTLHMLLPPSPPSDDEVISMILHNDDPVISMMPPSDTTEVMTESSKEATTVEPSHLTNPYDIITYIQQQEQIEEPVFTPGEFLYIESNSTRQMIKTAWDAVNLLELWNYMRQTTPTFMFNSDKQLNIIYTKIEDLGYTGHSGFTFGYTMRQIQYIAQHGEQQFMRSYLTSEN